MRREPPVPGLPPPVCMQGQETTCGEPGGPSPILGVMLLEFLQCWRTCSCFASELSERRKPIFSSGEKPEARLRPACGNGKWKCNSWRAVCSWSLCVVFGQEAGEEIARKSSFSTCVKQLLAEPELPVSAVRPNQDWTQTFGC